MDGLAGLGRQYPVVVNGRGRRQRGLDDIPQGCIGIRSYQGLGIVWGKDGVNIQSPTKAVGSALMDMSHLG